MRALQSNLITHKCVRYQEIVVGYLFFYIDFYFEYSFDCIFLLCRLDSFQVIFVKFLSSREVILGGHLPLMHLIMQLSSSEVLHLSLPYSKVLFLWLHLNVTSSLCEVICLRDVFPVRHILLSTGKLVYQVCPAWVKLCPPKVRKHSLHRKKNWDLEPPSQLCWETRCLVMLFSHISANILIFIEVLKWMNAQAIRIPLNFE